jgi:oligopeptide transport system permease protein
MYGSRIGLIVGFVPVTIIFVIGMSIGMLAGYLGGWVDNFLMRLTDVIYAFPDLLFVIIIVAMLRSTGAGDLMGGLLVIFVGIAVVNWVGLARLVRGQVLSIKHREFVEAARAVGASPVWIMTRHIFPNILAPVIVSVAFAIPGALLTEATLSFIGIGIKPPTPSLGTMIADGFVVFSTTPWPVLLPALCISVLLLAFTFIGDGLRDALDPRSSM